MRWIILLVLGHFSTAVLIGQRSLADYLTLGWLSETLSILLIPPLIIVIYLLSRAMLARPESLFAHVGQIVKEQHIRFIDGMMLLGCFVLVNRAYRAIKVSIPSIEPFWADPVFARWDAILFGTDPWRISHAMLGATGTAFLDRMYLAWMLVMLTAFACAAFSGDRLFRLRACATYFIIWIGLGNLGALLLSSAGPAYYQEFFGSNHYVPLIAILTEQDVVALKLQSYLLSVVGDETIGSGISAMPSVHCAMTMLIVLMVWDRFGLGWQFALAATYHLLIFIGSFHLAWHYALDGIVSMVLVALVWFGLGMLRYTKPAPASAPSP